jgi:hypothetical protein
MWAGISGLKSPSKFIGTARLMWAMDLQPISMFFLFPYFFWWKKIGLRSEIVILVKKNHKPEM